MSEVYHDTQFPTSKYCKRCGTEKPLEAFYAQRLGKYGRTSMCIECHRAWSSFYRFRRYTIPKLIQPPLFKETKVCTRCGVEKPIDSFRRSPGKADGCREQCKECMTELYRARPRRPVTEKHRQTKLAYRRAHPEKIREYGRKYFSRNKELAHAQNAEWRKNNHAWTRERDRRRVAMKRAVTVEKVDYRNILARDGYHCYICDKPVKPEDVQYDHVIPLIRGGAHAEDNIKVTHAICNQRKRDRLLEEMTPHQRRGPD